MHFPIPTLPNDTIHICCACSKFHSFVQHKRKQNTHKKKLNKTTSNTDQERSKYIYRTFFSCNLDFVVEIFSILWHFLPRRCHCYFHFIMTKYSFPFLRFHVVQIKHHRSCSKWIFRSRVYRHQWQWFFLFFCCCCCFWCFFFSFCGISSIFSCCEMKNNRPMLITFFCCFDRFNSFLFFVLLLVRQCIC